MSSNIFLTNFVNSIMIVSTVNTFVYQQINLFKRKHDANWNYINVMGLSFVKVPNKILLYKIQLIDYPLLLKPYPSFTKPHSLIRCRQQPILDQTRIVYANFQQSIAKLSAFSFLASDRGQRLRKKNLTKHASIYLIQQDIKIWPKI